MGLLLTACDVQSGWSFHNLGQGLPNFSMPWPQNITLNLFSVLFAVQKLLHMFIITRLSTNTLMILAMVVSSTAGLSVLSVPVISFDTNPSMLHSLGQLEEQTT